eukprot:211601_1
MHDILLGVGFQYAFCRQFIFLTNALLIGCGMALIAAGVQKSDSDLFLWLGDTWYQALMALGGSVLLTTLLGCLGACYQNRMALILYMIVLAILILSEVIIVFFIFNAEFDEILSERWSGLDRDLKSRIAEQFDCDCDCATSTTSTQVPFINGTELDCVQAARKEAESFGNVVIFICGGIILYQIVMMSFTAFYLKGLKQKKARERSMSEPKQHEKMLSPKNDVLE